ncbi:MAG: Substrate-binding region of ABC-type glycine betaine transport system [Bryobacterales bacterium]|jgi:osmoprotectant transport system substrate-binding protein|nr:Substrate-binding region of ABC-type glycine betaine transport system [Bryobacterales bacterium]
MLRVPSAALLCVFFLASCGGSKKPVVVGSKNETEQMLLGEIVAQHLEHRLGRTVERRSGLGGTAVLYQSILSGEVGIYPEYTGLIESEILKEPAAPNPQVVLARVRQEMDRVAQLEVLDPLGFDNPSAIVVNSKGTEKLASLSDAAASDKRWKLGVTYEFQSRADGLQELASYRLSLLQRTLDPQQLFAELEKGGVDMIASRATDGHLMSADWKVLADDRKVFPSYEACLLVRKDLSAAEPGLRPALAELSGKFRADTMRKLNAEVDLERRPLATVATDFLTQAGLH